MFHSLPARLHLAVRFIAVLALLAASSVAQSPTMVSKFAYVANQHANTLSGYMIDGATGSLTEISGSPFPAGNSPRSLSTDPQGRFLYEADWYSASVSAYAIDGSTGVLTEIPGSPFPAGPETAAVVVDASGHFVFAANQYGNSVSAYTINSATGALTAVAGSPFAAGYWPVGLAVAPSGKYLYVANWSSGSVSAFAIDSITGRLAEIPGSPFSAGGGAFQVAMTPSGNFAYVAVQAGSVYAYSVNTLTGALSAVAGSPFAAGDGPYYVAVDALGKFAYVANFFSNNVSGYAINQTSGALTPITGSPFPAGTSPGGLTIDLSGRFLYTANFNSDNSSAFAIDPLTGALKPVPGSPFATGYRPISVTTTGSSGPLIPTTTSLTSNLDPSVYGQSAPFAVQVTADSGTPIGTVQILNGSTVLGRGTLATGSVLIPISTLPAGNNSIFASYSGGGGFAGSKSDTRIQTVSQATTNTSLRSSLNPAGANQMVRFSATVTSQYGGIATGTVSFSAGSQSLGSATLSGNVATISTSFATAGSYAIAAQYNGDSNNTGSSSGTLTENVSASTTKSTTSTMLSSTRNPSIYGQQINFTAVVTTAGSLPPTGTVDFTWGTAYVRYNIGTITLNSAGAATLIKSNLNADPYPITAIYRGDANNLASTSPVLNQTVLQTTSAASITAMPNPSFVGQAVTFTARFTSPTVIPTGPVTFTSGTTILGTTQLSGGKGVFTTPLLPAGSNTITVTFKGNSNIAKSSASVTQVVNP